MSCRHLQPWLAAVLLVTTDGAPAGETFDLERGSEFWAYRPPVKAEPPAVSDPDWQQSPIDRFVRARLEGEGKSAPPAVAKLSLVRRAYFDLHGLPPTPAQIDAFLADTAPGAFEKLVDELLASPHFGERWGRHWLDVVRFAESTGGGRTMLLEHSWRYRDYVVDAFNRDKPYDQFVTEQLAGDLLPDSDPGARRDHLVATTFLALGPSNYELQDKELLRMEIIDEQVDTVGRAFMAMTLGCARCHDHMFDPISARDYYALAGIFHSTKTVEHSNVSKWLMADLPAITPEEKHAAGAHAVFKQRLAQTKAAIAAAEAEMSNLRDSNLAGGIVIDDSDERVERSGEWVGSTSVQKWVGKGYLHDGSGDEGPRAIVYKPELPEAGRYEVRVSYSAGSNRSGMTPVTVHHAGGENTVRIDQRKKPAIGGLFNSVGIYEFDKGSGGSVQISNTGAEDGVTIADAVQFLLVGSNPSTSGADAANLARRAALDKELAELHRALGEIAKSEPKLVKLQTMTVRDEARPGDTHLSIRGDVHSPGELVPRAVPVAIEAGYRPIFTDEQSGRLELARWLVADGHPLTARVMANRLWANLMGEGIVKTTDNFGATGERPSNPELLDWLALRLVENGWSVKQTLRDMLLTRTYRSARPQPRRLDAEALRDAVLAASGQLDLTIGGPTIKPGTQSEFGYKFDSPRRSLYLPVFRNALPELFAVFDFPDPNLVAGTRNASTLPTQALYFMNHPFVIGQSKHAAAALIQLEGTDTRGRVEIAYRGTLGRLPSAAELALALDFLGASPAPQDWASFYQSLFACIDFRYVE